MTTLFLCSEVYPTFSTSIKSRHKFSPLLFIDTHVIYIVSYRIQSIFLLTTREYHSVPRTVVAARVLSYYHQLKYLIKARARLLTTKGSLGRSEEIFFLYPRKTYKNGSLPNRDSNVLQVATHVESSADYLWN